MLDPLSHTSLAVLMKSKLSLNKFYVGKHSKDNLSENRHHLLSPNILIVFLGYNPPKNLYHGAVNQIKRSCLVKKNMYFNYPSSILTI